MHNTTTLSLVWIFGKKVTSLSQSKKDFHSITTLAPSRKAKNFNGYQVKMNTRVEEADDGKSRPLHQHKERDVGPGKAVRYFVVVPSIPTKKPMYHCSSVEITDHHLTS